MMKKKFDIRAVYGKIIYGPALGILLLCALLTPVFLASCSQDAIFYIISREEKIKKPRIPGVPTNIVEYNGDVYVANYSSLHRYSGGGNWEKLGKPGGNFIALAATSNRLYALMMTGSRPDSARLYRSQNGNNWNEVDFAAGGYPNLQTIYADTTTLFAGAWDGYFTGTQNYAIFYDNGTNLQQIITNTSLLTGAAYSGTNHYLATNEDGIYVASGTPPSSPTQLYNSADSNDTDRNSVGIITVGTNVVAVERQGDILSANATTFSVLASPNQTMTGAIALWPSTGTPQLLLLGVQVNGYREIVLTAGNIGSMALQVPGTVDTVSSVPKDGVYSATLGSRQVNFLYQAPDGTLFASTQGEGLWSCRDNQWNAEPE
jgi:hypothetical protein